ncbi:hypothetical protein Brsp06_04953 [Brucella sp. NBRC 13694]|jgi:hypothetical protein|uniref:hypothetical protein n=1 Tax=Brucella/Ochrobactrum group TaxID=2826938 RepID=UPI000F686A97|nr:MULTISPECIES: hypothetical protein [Brucella/Ochrobactrum group]MCQ9148383.1 hypothetical protein [Ochrobactrum sp. BTU2]MCR5943627.1 hypothetical protein [Ochrobactrum sp. XJ1]RRY15705.1 hypothetical protein EGJ57_24160 [Brucella anthropi]
MKTYEIDRMMVRCFVFIGAVNIVGSLMLLQVGTTTNHEAGSTAILQITTMVCVYAVMASAYGISTTRGAERVFSVLLCVMFCVMLNIEARAEFLGIGIVSISALIVAAALTSVIARANPRQTLICASQLRNFAFSRSSILFAAALLVYAIARTTERVGGQAPETEWSWLLHQASFMSVMFLFLYAACPYIKHHTGH